MKSHGYGLITEDVTFTSTDPTVVEQSGSVSKGLTDGMVSVQVVLQDTNQFNRKYFLNCIPRIVCSFCSQEFEQ